jgi:PPOX class probable FMN-dependent enzyme
MEWITDLDTLHSHYDVPKPPALRKVTAHLTPAYRDFIQAARFCILSTIGPEGVDGSPRGDAGPVVMVLDARTLALPDWRGNDRIDSLRNIVRDGRMALYFMVTGSTISVRINGRARLTADPALRQRFERDGQNPRTVMVIAIDEVYSQCARALQRSALWETAGPPPDLPSFGQMLQEATEGDIDGADYDRARAARAHLGWW